jgi:putative transposase
MRHRRPPRIDRFDYIGPHVYFLTICTFDRSRWFVDPHCANDATVELLRTAAGYGFAVTAYCFMPDHLHTLLEGTRDDSDFVKCAAMFKQRSAFTHARRYGGQLWQHSYFEHVLRRDDDCLAIAAYIVANPFRAGLCNEIAEYPFVGSDRFTIDQLCMAIQAIPTWK